MAKCQCGREMLKANGCRFKQSYYMRNGNVGIIPWHKPYN